MQKEEIDEVKYLSIDKIKELIKSLPFHPFGKVVFEKYLEMKKF